MKKRVIYNLVNGDYPLNIIIRRALKICPQIASFYSAVILLGFVAVITSFRKSHYDETDRLAERMLRERPDNPESFIEGILNEYRENGKLGYRKEVFNTYHDEELTFYLVSEKPAPPESMGDNQLWYMKEV